MITKKQINDVLEKLSLVSLAKETIKLRKQKNYYVGKCPFHADTGKSFHIRQDKYFCCFGCGAAGNAISFYIKNTGYSFAKAVEKLLFKLK